MVGKALIHDGENKGDGWKAVSHNDGSKERKEKRTLESGNGGHEWTTSEDPRVAVIGMPLHALMVTATQPCDYRNMNGKKDGSRANQKCSFPNLLGQDQTQTSGGKN